MVLALLGLAACGGDRTTAPHTPTATASAARTAIAGGTLTIRFPAGYRTASRDAGAPASAARRATYVNPTGGNVLDIYVDGTLVRGLDGTQFHSVTVAASADGTQTISNVPLYSTNSDIAVVEWESSATSVLAVGETLPGTVSVVPGGTAAITLTMQMNLSGFAITTAADGSSSTALASGQPYTIGAAGSPALVYLYPTDALGGYTSAVPPSGFDGVPGNLTVSASSSHGSRIGRQLLGGYEVSYGANEPAFTITVGATNPATAAVTDGATLAVLAASGPLQGKIRGPSITVTPQLAREATVTTLAGATDGSSGFLDGTGTAARFSRPAGIAADPNGNALYVGDYYNNAIRKLTRSGSQWNVTTLAVGNPPLCCTNTAGVALDPSGTIYLTHLYYSSAVYQLTYAGAWNETLYAGGIAGFTDGSLGTAQFTTPYGVAFDGSGNMYVADTGNYAVRKITFPGGVGTVATIAAGGSGYLDGPGASARFNSPVSITVDPAGNVFVADDANDAIRMLAPAGGSYTVTTVAGGVQYSCASGAPCVGETAFRDGPYGTSRVCRPQGVAADANGNVYIADSCNHAIRKLSQSGGVWTVATLAGGGPHAGGVQVGVAGSVDGRGSVARFSSPGGIAVDAAGNVYVAENNAIRMIAP